MRQKTPSSFTFRAVAIASFAFSALSLNLACSSSDPDDGGVAGSPAGGAAGGSAPTFGGAAGKPSAGAAGAPTGGTGGTAGGQAGTPNVGGSLSSAGQGGGGVAGRGGSSGAGAGGKMDGGKAGSGGSAGSGTPTSGAGGTSAGSGGTSGGSAGTAGSNGGSTGFNPCPPAGTACKILPLGDSITDGIGFSGGYRVELFHLAHADNKTITYLGGSMNGPNMVDGVTFPKNHEGHSGWTIAQIDGIVPTPALQTLPNIILLHIGTNDMYGAMPATSPERLATLLDGIVMAAPDALLVVAKIIPVPSSASQVTSFNNAVPGLIMTRANAGKHIIMVDQFMGFPTNELGDGVHPNQAGYSRMAKVWYDAIKTYLH